MKTQKPKRSHWFSFVVGGIAFMVLACSAAEARKYVTDYQTNPSGYVVAVNKATKQTMIMKQIQDTAKQDRSRLLQKNKTLLNVNSTEKSHTIKARIKRVGGTLLITTSLYISGSKADEATSTIPAPPCPASAIRACGTRGLCLGTAKTKQNLPHTLTTGVTETLFANDRWAICSTSPS